MLDSNGNLVVYGIVVELYVVVSYMKDYSFLYFLNSNSDYNI